MRSLFVIYPGSPLPLDTGGSIRYWNLFRALRGLARSTSGSWTNQTRDAPISCGPRRARDGFMPTDPPFATGALIRLDWASGPSPALAGVRHNGDASAVRRVAGSRLRRRVVGRRDVLRDPWSPCARATSGGRR